jgi:hypothetical protein
MKTIARDRQEVAVGICLRLYEPWGCTLSTSTSEVLVATDSHNYETNVALPQFSYTMPHRINRHTGIRLPNDSSTMERRCMGNISRNY